MVFFIWKKELDCYVIVKMATSSNMLCFEGCNFFRQRLILATLSGRSVKIKKIRYKDDDPGLKGKCCHVQQKLRTFKFRLSWNMSDIKVTLAHQKPVGLHCPIDMYPYNLFPAVVFHIHHYCADHDNQATGLWAREKLNGQKLKKSWTASHRRINSRLSFRVLTADFRGSL